MLTRVPLLVISLAVALSLACREQDTVPASDPVRTEPAPTAAAPPDAVEPAPSPTREFPAEFPLRPLEGFEVQRVQSGQAGPQRQYTNVFVRYPAGREDELAAHFAGEIERLGMKASRMDRGEGEQRNISLQADQGGQAFGVMIRRQDESSIVSLSWNRPPD